MEKGGVETCIHSWTEIPLYLLLLFLAGIPNTAKTCFQSNIPTKLLQHNYQVSFTDFYFMQ